MGRKWIVWIFLVVFVTGRCQLSHAAITHSGDVSSDPDDGSAEGPFRIGNTGLGTMNISNGPALTSTSNAFVGDGENGIGIVTMSGLGSNWTLTSPGADISIGVDGTGTVSLSSMARMIVPGDTTLGADPTGVGRVNVASLGSVWTTGSSTTFGNAGLGIVNVTGGGQFLSNGNATLGDLATGEGRVTIEDELSLWRIESELTVADAGRGTLSILDGGTLRSEVTSIGRLSGSVGLVEVNGPGALWNVTSGSVTAGASGTGNIHVLNGGRASFVQNLHLGNVTGSRGEVWVDGLHSTLTVGQLVSAGEGESDVTISNGGTVRTSTLNWGVPGRLTLGGGRLEVTATSGLTNQGLIQGDGTIDTLSFQNQVGQGGATRGRLQVGEGEHLVLTGGLVNAGLVDVNGGELEVLNLTGNSSDIDARNGATLRFNGSTFALDNTSGSQLAISSGQVDVFGAVRNNNGAQILVGNGASAVFHDTITNNGEIVVLPGSTLLALEQLNLLTNSSSLSVQLGEFDSLGEEFPVQSAGTLIIEGNLNVTLAAGYQPEAGDVFPLLTSGDQLAGVFTNQNLPTLGGGLTWETIRTTDTLSLAVVAAGLAGDFDNDGDVDGRDFLTWQRNPAIGDLADWRANYGTGPLVAELAEAVPEPAMLSLLLWCTTLTFYSRSGYARQKCVTRSLSHSVSTTSARIRVASPDIGV